jgi:hypothetical protein
MAGNFVLVDKFTVTTPVASVVLGGGSAGSSGLNVTIDTDTPYVVVLAKADCATDRVGYWHFTESGVANTTANYSNGGRIQYATTSSVSSGNVATSGYISKSRMESNSGFNMIMHIFDAIDSSNFTNATINTVHDLQDSQTGTIVSWHSITTMETASAVDGIQFTLEASDNWSGGDFYLYKVV